MTVLRSQSAVIISISILRNQSLDISKNAGKYLIVSIFRYMQYRITSPGTLCVMTRLTFDTRTFFQIGYGVTAGRREYVTVPRTI